MYIVIYIVPRRNIRLDSFKKKKKELLTQHFLKYNEMYTKIHIIGYTLNVIQQIKYGKYRKKY